MATASATGTTQRFDRLIANDSCRLVDINEHLLCALCSGYLVDATTIIECLHTFCRSCIVRYLESSETCPVCDVPLHQTNPLLGIRSDTTLQTLVYKLVPGIYKDEVKRRCSVINNAHSDGKPGSVMDRLLKDICDMTTGGTIYTGDEKFSVCLQYAPSSVDSPLNSAASLKQLCSKKSEATTCQKVQQDLTDCSYLLCPASLTVGHLKKLIRNKLDLTLDLPLDLYHSSGDTSLDDGFCLADAAYITAWTGVKPLHFFYRVNTNTSQSDVQPLCDQNLTIHVHSKPEKRSKGTPFKSSVANAKSNTAACTRETGLKGGPRRPKAPPGKCLSEKKTLASQNKFKNVYAATKTDNKQSVKPGTQAKQSVRPKSGLPSDKNSAVEDVTQIPSKENDSLMVLEEDTLEGYPIHITECDTDVIVSDVKDISCAQRTATKRSYGDAVAESESIETQRPAGECFNLVDSALSPSHPELVTQSLPVADSSDAVSDTEGGATAAAVDSGKSQPPTKTRKTEAPAPDRNLFAVINSMIVSSGNNNSNNDNVVSSSTSSQTSADDSSDSNATKTSVETQTSANLMNRRMKKNKLRSKKDLSAQRSAKQKDADAHGDGCPLKTVSAHTSSQSIAVAAHSYSTATSASPCASTTLCVPICIGDKGSNLILNLPQNVSVQCRIRSDKIVIASSPTTTNSEVISAFSSISYSETTTISSAGQNNGATDTGKCKAPSFKPSTVVVSSPALSTTDDGPSLAGQRCESESNATESISEATITSLPSKQITKLENKEQSQMISDPSESVSRSKNTDTCAAFIDTSAHISGLLADDIGVSDCLESTFKSDNFGCGKSAAHDRRVRSAELVCTDASQAVKNAQLSRKSATAQETCSVTLGTMVSEIPSSATEKHDESVPCLERRHVTAEIVEENSNQVIVSDTRDQVTQHNMHIHEAPQCILKEKTLVPDTSCQCTPTPPDSTPKVVLFKPYQMGTTSESKLPKRVPDAISTSAAFQMSVQSVGVYSNPSSFQVFPAFPYPKGSAPAVKAREEGVSNSYRCLLSDSLSIRSAETKPDPVKSGAAAAIHCTASNIPLRNVIKVPIYTATCRKTPVNRKSERKSLSGSKAAASGSSGNVRRSSEAPLSNKETPEIQSTPCSEVIGVDSANEDIAKIGSIPIHSLHYERESGVVNMNKVIKDQPKDSCYAIRSQANTASTFSGSKGLDQLTAVDQLDRSRPSSSSLSSCAISTSDGHWSPSQATDSDSPRKAASARLNSESIGVSTPAARVQRNCSPRRRSEKTRSIDEMTYTRAEADSGTSPTAGSVSPPRSGSSKEESQADGPSSFQSAVRNTKIKKKLVIDLERCCAIQSKPCDRLNCCSPTTTLLAAETKCSKQQTPPAKLVISLPRCQVPLATPAAPGPKTDAGTVSTATNHDCLSRWSPPSSSSADNNSPPTTKRLKLMCKGMTIYRTLESPGSRSQRTDRGLAGGGGGGGRKSSPVSAPPLDCQSSRTSMLGTLVSSNGPPIGRCRRRLSAGGGSGKAAIVGSGEPSVVISVDSTSTSPRLVAASSPPQSSNNNSVFTVGSGWKDLDRSISLPELNSVDGPLELTTKEVKERQKEKEYEKLMSSLRPPSTCTT